MVCYRSVTQRTAFRRHENACCAGCTKICLTISARLGRVSASGRSMMGCGLNGRSGVISVNGNPTIGVIFTKKGKKKKGVAH